MMLKMEIKFLTNSGIVQILNFIISFGLIKLAKPELYGVFLLIQSSVGLLFGLISIRQADLLIKSLNECESKIIRSKLIKSAIFINAVTGAIAIVLSGLVIYIIGESDEIYTQNKIIYLYPIALAAAGFMPIAQAVTRYFQMDGLYTLLYGLEVYTRFIIIVIFFLSVKELNLANLVFIYASSSIIGMFVAFFIIYRYGLRGNLSNIFVLPWKIENSFYWKQIKETYIVESISNFQGKSDMVIVGAILGPINLTAYKVFKNFYTIFNNFAQALKGIHYDRIAKVLNTSSPEVALDYSAKLSVKYFPIIILFSAFAIAISPAAFLYLHIPVASVWLKIAPMVFGGALLLLYFWQHPFMLLLNDFRSYKFVIKLDLILSVLHLAILTYLFGLIGASISIFLSALFPVVYAKVYFHRRFGAQ
jgi:O-antigen/teichoic acid export membrane protein